MTPALTGYLWCALAALSSAVATLLIKFSGQHGADWNLVRLGWLGGAVVTYALGFVCYSLALQKLEISLAYPVMTGIAMVMVAALGFTFLHEPMSWSKAAGMLLIGAGAFALTR